MRGSKVFMTVVAAGTLALWGGVALAAAEASKPVFHRVRGEVTAVEPGARTMMVKTMQGKKELTVGVDITDKTMIRQGKAHKTLSDIKVGDRVWMKYERANDKSVAEYVHILKPQHLAAKK